MKAQATLDVSYLEPWGHGSESPLWWGFIGILAIEVTVFSSLIASYFYLRMGEPHWPPAGLDPPDLLLPTINTGVLIVSSFFMSHADKSGEKGYRKGMLTGLIGGIVLALVFLSLKVVEYSGVAYRWDSNPYSSIVWTITGFHAAHVLSVVLKTMVMAYLSYYGFFNEKRHLGITVNGIYWHFVVIVWLPLYVVLCWAPRVL
jgi:cytochrome c oxidase subunit III